MSDIALTLTDLAAQINANHQAAIKHATTALEHACRAGELLTQAKSQVAHGGWLEWLAANCEVSPRQAQRYMKVANNWETISKNDATSYLTIDGAIAHVRTAATREEVTAAVTERFSSLPEGMALERLDRDGYSVLFRSARHPEFIHHRSIVLSTGENNCTLRPMRPLGIAVLLEASGMSLEEFCEVSAATVEPWCLDETYDPTQPRVPPASDFWQMMQGAST